MAPKPGGVDDPVANWGPDRSSGLLDETGEATGEATGEVTSSRDGLSTVAPLGWIAATLEPCLGAGSGNVLALAALIRGEPPVIHPGSFRAVWRLHRASEPGEAETIPPHAAASEHPPAETPERTDPIAPTELENTEPGQVGVGHPLLVRRRSVRFDERLVVIIAALTVAVVWFLLS